MKYQGIPKELQQHGRFCCWRLEERQGRKTKIPYNPRTGENAKSNDPMTFTSFNQAAESNGYDGIGIGIFDGVCAIDIDGCVENGVMSEMAMDIISTMHSYTEISPSGNGVHILFSTNGFIYDTRKYYIMNRGIGVEIYVSGTTNKYVTMTGNVCTEYEYGERGSELQIILDRYMMKPPAQNGYGTVAVNAINAAYVPDMLSENELWQIAMRSKNGEAFARLWRGDITGYASHSEADMALCCHLAFWTGKNPVMMDSLFRKSGLIRDKWDEKRSGSTYGQVTIRNAIDHCDDTFTAAKETTPVIMSEPSMKPEEKKAEFNPLVPLKPKYCDLPSFPTDCLPEPLRNYVLAVSAHSQTAPDMAAVIGLGILAACLQKKYRVEGTPGYYEQLSLYTVVIAVPGERKSGVLHDMTKVLEEYEAESNNALAAEIKENRRVRETVERKITAMETRLQHKENEADEKKLQELKDELDSLPVIKEIRYSADDCSSEALTSLLAGNGGRMAVISSEGGIFDIMTGRYSNKVNIDVWLKGWCGDQIRVDRMGRESEFISRPALTAILAIQPSVLDEIMASTTMSGRGLIARFLYAFPPSRIGERTFCAPAISPETFEEYRALIFRLMAMPVNEEEITLKLSAEATVVISDYFRQHEAFLTGEGQDISDWANKYIGTILRIAGLIHVADGKEKASEISASTMKNAISIGKYFLAHARYAYSMMGTDITIQKAIFVLAKIRNAKATDMKRSDLFQMCRGKFFKKTEDIFPTLELLEERGYLRTDTPEICGAGRPKDTHVYINPEALAA